jgi:hypothetical protein
MLRRAFLEAPACCDSLLSAEHNAAFVPAQYLGCLRRDPHRTDERQPTGGCFLLVQAFSLPFFSSDPLIPKLGLCTDNSPRLATRAVH